MQVLLRITGLKMSVMLIVMPKDAFTGLSSTTSLP